MNDDFSIARTNYFIDFKNELILNILKDKELPVSKEEYIKIMGYIEGENEKHTLTQFNNYETLNKVSKFCIPKNLHFEKLLCSLYVLAKNNTFS